MSKNIEININNGITYETLYPKTLGSLVDGKVSSSTQSDSANTLTTGRTIRTNLASTSTATFDGSSNITPGVSGTLTVSNGGTGVTSYSALATQLNSYINSGCELVCVDYTGNGSNQQNITLSHTKTNCQAIFITVNGMFSSLGSNASNFSYGIMTLPNGTNSGVYTLTVGGDGGIGTYNGIIYPYANYIRVKEIFNFNGAPYRMIVFYI